MTLRTEKQQRARVARKVEAYKGLFQPHGETGPVALVVLADLARICYAQKSTANANPTAMAVAEGRRQVWLYIQTQLGMSLDQLQQLTEVLDD